MKFTQLKIDTAGVMHRSSHFKWESDGNFSLTRHPGDENEIERLRMRVGFDLACRHWLENGRPYCKPARGPAYFIPDRQGALCQ